MNRKLLLTCSSVVLLVLAMAFAACGDDDDKSTPTPSPTPDPAQVKDVEDTATKLLEADPTSTADVTFWLDHATAKGVTYFGYKDRASCEQNAEDCIGDPTTVSGTSDTKIDGDNASTVAATENGNVKVLFLKESNVWKLNGYAFLADAPTGAKTITISAVDYGYDWDKTGLVAGKPLAFQMKNDGQESHEIAFVGVEEDFDPQDVIDAINDGTASQSELPPGVTDFYNFTAATPGETASAAFEEGLEAGKYAFICFYPTLSDGKPHIVKGMSSVFDVTAAP